jgi:hypothetical protein
MISRRGFVGAIAAAFVVDPDRLLWVRGAKLISVPAVRVADPWDALKLDPRCLTFEEIDARYWQPAWREWERRSVAADQRFLERYGYRSPPL